MCRFWTQVDGRSAVGSRADFGLEHKVKLAYVSPVARAADGADDFLVKDNLLELGEVHGVHGAAVALVQGVAFGLMFEHAGVGGAELGFVESIAEALGCFGNFLVNLLVVFGYLVLNEYVSAVALLAVAVVDEGVVEGVDVARGFPNGGVHENGTVKPDNVVVQQHHTLPPVLLNVVFQFYAVLSVVIDGCQTVVDIAAGEHEAVLLAVRNDFLEHIFLCHGSLLVYGSFTCWPQS